MPLPLLVWGAIGAAGALGLGKGAKAVMDNSKANDINASANRLLDDAKKRNEMCRKSAQKSLEAIGSKKVFTLNTGIGKFIKVYENLNKVELADSTGLKELDKFRLDTGSFQELKELKSYASSISSGLGGGALGGALVAFGAYNGAMMLGAASTGTAIASLSGAAATNATLAFLGGGSLAAGGLGIAGGTMVLGGLIAAPALAVMGFVLGSKASANLDNARSNRAEARKIAEELETASLLCNSIRRRSYMMERLLVRLDALLLTNVFQMEKTIVTRGVDYSRYTQDEKNAVAQAAALATAIKSVINTPILTTEGRLTNESEQTASNVQKALGNI